MTREEIEKVAQEVLDENPGLIQRWHNGEKGHMNFFMKQVLIKTSHRANGKLAVVILGELIKKK